MIKKPGTKIVLIGLICLTLIIITGCSSDYDDIDTEGVKAAMKIEQISEHIWMMPQNEDTDRPNLYLIVGDDSAVMVDAGNSEAQVKEFYSELRSNNLPEPEAVLLTHWHWDHSFGSAYIPADVYSHPITQGFLTIAATYEYTDEAIAERVKDGAENEYVEETQKLEMTDEQRENLKIRVPDKTIEDGQQFYLGGVTVTAQYINCDQSDDMVMYYVEEDDVLLIGDIMYEDYYHGPDHFSATKLNSIIEDIKAHPASQFHGSHTDGMISKDELIAFYENILKNSVWEFGGDSWETIVMEW